jgi:flagellar hook-basal body complex protein FliE
MTPSIAAVQNFVPASLDALQSTSTTPASAAPGFGQAMDAQVEAVNTDLRTAETSLQKLSSGQPVELHDVMISLERARIGVQMLMQVRDRALEAYQEFMRMQV